MSESTTDDSQQSTDQSDTDNAVAFSGAVDERMDLGTIDAVRQGDYS